MNRIGDGPFGSLTLLANVLPLTTFAPPNCAILAGMKANGISGVVPRIYMNGGGGSCDSNGINVLSFSFDQEVQDVPRIDVSLSLRA